MAYNSKFSNLDGTMDTTLGLIMRLNYLWTEADNNAKAGKYSEWNFTLDAIWRNLSYREPIMPIREIDEQGVETEKIVDVELSDDDKKIWTILNSAVRNAQKEMFFASRSQNRQKINSATYSLYWALEMKDLGLRKFQHKLHLYVKEKSKNPSNAMWGG